ncbi:MAG: DUF2974 domain-containing protein [Lachnospiraceae bacterium]|nr:DUF2974 domain-containing protein [Lachnospiraceae bacterium]
MAYNGGERTNGVRMLSTGEILLLNQLMYCPEEEKRSIDEYQGNTIGEWMDSWSQRPLTEEAECGLCMKGKEWNRIVRLIAGNLRLCRMKNHDVHWDEADGGGGGLSAVFVEPCLGEAVVVFRGTAAGEWRDDFLGGAATGEQDGVSTIQQKNAREWYCSLGLPKYFSEITVTGHSKGGNKAKYIALMETSVSRCLSFDGQGFSDEFVKKYQQRIRERQPVIENHNMEYDYVNILLNDVGRAIYYQRFADEARGFWETHCVNAFFWFGEENTCFLVRSGKTKAKELQEVNRFLNSCLRSLPEEKKIAAMELLGAIAERRLGDGKAERGDGKSEEEERNYLIRLLLQGENPDVLVYLLAYLLKYQQVEPGLADSIERIGERFGVLSMQRFAKIIEGISAWKYSGVFMSGAGILAAVMPEAFWDKLHKFLADSYGITVSGKDLQSLAARFAQVMQLQSKIRILPGKGEDLHV